MEEITIDDPFTEREILIAGINIQDPFEPSTNPIGAVNLRKRRCPSLIDIEEVHALLIMHL